jgi:hypothetical protein
MMPYELPADNVHVGPSDYVRWLTDRKWCYLRVEGTTFGDVPLNLELNLEVWDSPNSAGVVIDSVRCAKRIAATTGPAPRGGLSRLKSAWSSGRMALRAERLVARYLPGEPVTVYYDPDHPQEAVLEQGAD